MNTGKAFPDGGRYCAPAMRYHLDAYTRTSINHLSRNTLQCCSLNLEIKADPYPDWWICGNLGWIHSLPTTCLFSPTSPLGQALLLFSTALQMYCKELWSWERKSAACSEGKKVSYTLVSILCVLLQLGKGAREAAMGLVLHIAG